MTCEEVFPLSLLGIPFFSVLMALSVHTVRADFFFFNMFDSSGD